MTAYLCCACVRSEKRRPAPSYGRQRIDAGENAASPTKGNQIDQRPKEKNIYIYIYKSNNNVSLNITFQHIGTCEITMTGKCNVAQVVAVAVAVAAVGVVVVANEK